MRARAATFAAATVLFLASAAPSASAYCRTTTVQVRAGFDPHVSGSCWPEGYPLWWRNACVGYDIQQNTSKQISYDVAASTIALAFTRWTTTTCTTLMHGVGQVSIDVRDLGPVACDMVQYNNEGGPNQHVILFDDDKWPYDDSSNTLALTTVTYDPSSGEIYDADMEINSHDYTLSTATPVPDGAYDFQAIVTHEAGHFLGMAHSGDVQATMYAHYSAGSDAMRELAHDDVNGICAVYPPDGTRTVSPAVAAPFATRETACDPTPMGGFSSTCVQGGSCGTAPQAPGRAGERGAWAGALAALVTLVARRRRAG